MISNLRSQISDLTPPGFSRWFFNFFATNQTETFLDNRELIQSLRGLVVAVKLEYHRLKPVVSLRVDSCSREVEVVSYLESIW
jgi:hypothetical protein